MGSPLFNMKRILVWFFDIVNNLDFWVIEKFQKPKNLQFRVSEKLLNQTSSGYGYLKKFKEPMGFRIQLAKEPIRLGYCI